MGVMDVDWKLAREMHDFCTDRAFERIAGAAATHDWASVNDEWRDLQALDTMYADAKRDPDAGGLATSSLRRRSIQDRDHPAFRRAWVIPDRVLQPRQG